MTLDETSLRRHAARFVDSPRDVEAFVERVKQRLLWRTEHGFKVCARCGEEKKPSEFYANSSREDGLHHTCRSCEKTRSRR